MRIEQAIAHAWALELKESCAKAVISNLQYLAGEMLSGDSGLINVWEEICAQVQGAESAEWSTYQEVIDSLVQVEVDSLGSEKLLAIWVQTDEGQAWVDEYFSADDGHQSAPMDTGGIVQLIMDSVMTSAADYESKSLYRFLQAAESEEDVEDADDEESEEGEDELSTGSAS